MLMSLLDVIERWSSELAVIGGQRFDLVSGSAGQCIADHPAAECHGQFVCEI